MVLRWAIVAILLLAGAGACGRSSRSRCERVCTVEAQCGEQLELADVDFAACVENCNELEREPRTHEAVLAHIKCVLVAKSCEETMECL